MNAPEGKGDPSTEPGEGADAPPPLMARTRAPRARGAPTLPGDP